MSIKKGQGVKFQDQHQNAQQNQLNNQDPNQEREKPKMQYKNIQQCQKLAQETFSNIDKEFKLYTENDPNVQRKDTANGIRCLLENIVELLDQINLGTFDDKTKTYYLIYNATIYLFDLCRFLRKSVYSSLCIDFLASAIVSLEGNIILQSIKYLEWRVKFYVELAHVYEECGSINAASKLIDRCIQKVQKAKELEEKDPPIPEYMEKLFTNNLRIIQALSIKFKLQTGSLNADAWRKIIEDQFQNDPQGKILAAIESLQIVDPRGSNTLENQQIPWKQQAVQQFFDMYKEDAKTIATALQQNFDKMGRAIEFGKVSQYMDEEKRNELINQNREQDVEMIKEKIWKKCSENLPLEYHVQFLHYALEVENFSAFEEMAEYAQTRVKFRRIEVPYINDLDLKYSNNMYPNRNNGFELDFVDLNQAKLREELRKLRNKNKAKGGSQQNQQKKEEKKPKDKAKEDPKKKGKALQQEEPETSEFNIDGGVGATPEELAEIDHRYVYITLQKTPNPRNAIFGVDITMEDQKDRNPEYWDQVSGQVKKKEIPVDQYIGVRESSNKTAWMFLKQTTKELINDDEKLNVVIDIKPLFGRNPLVRPEPGYIKIPVDLRQTPKEFIRSPNMEYVYITYKTDKQFFNVERELEILTAYHKLEQSYNANKIDTVEREKQAQLDIVYDMDLLFNLIKTIKNRLNGKIGNQFFEDRKDFLINLCFKIWKKYIKSPLYQKEFVYEQKISQEISEENFSIYKSLLQQASQVFLEALKVFNLILMRTKDCDLIWLCKINLELCKLLEDSEEYKQCAQNLRFCLGRINQFRDQKLNRGVESSKDLFLPFSITTNNLKIEQMLQQMKESYYKAKNKINEEIRVQNRARKQKQSNKKLNPLQNDELQEEEWENLEAANIHMNDDNKDSHYFKCLDQHNKWSEKERIINSLHADILCNLFRNELKAGKQLGKANYTRNKVLAQMKEEKSDIYMTQSQSQRLKDLPLGENYDGIPDKEKMKTTLMQAQTAKQIKKNHQTLQNTLIQEGYLEPPKPHIQNYEQILLQEANQNPYQNALLHMILASNKTKEPDQISLLQQSYAFLKQAEAQEDLHLQNGIKDSIFVLSTLLNNKETKQNSNYYFPFDQLYKPSMVKKSKVPRAPVLISRSSSSITFKLPPFQPLINLPPTAVLDPNREKIESMALYGKVSQNKTDVSLTNTDLNNTGIRHKISQIVTVKNLLQNEKYCFAVGAYDFNEQLSNSEIGKTGEDVVCLQPLSIPQLSSYLAKISYQIGDFQTAELAADNCLKYFTEKSEFLDRNLDYVENPIYYFRLIQKALKQVSIIEIQNLTETLLVKSRCLKRKFFVIKDGDMSSFKMKPGTIMIQHQKNILTVANYLLMAVETALCVNNYILGKKIGLELYNLLGEMLQMKTKTIYTFHLMLKGQIMMNDIPEQYWDQNLRILSAKYTYEITKMSFQFNEVNLGKRNMYTQIKQFNRKWYTFTKIQMVPEEIQEKKDDKKGKKDSKKGGKQKPLASNQELEEQVKLVPKLVRELYEQPTSVQGFLEQTLLSFSEDYQDYVQRFVDTWKERIEAYLPFVETTQEENDQILSELQEQLEFWNTLRDINTGYQKIQSQFKGSPIYLEIICRFAKRLMESGTQPDFTYQCLEQFTELPTSEALQLALEINDLKKEAISHDIDWFPNMLGVLQEELETTKQGNEKAIEIFKNYFSKTQKLSQKLVLPQDPPKHQNFFYLTKFSSEFFALKAASFYLTKNPSPFSEQTTSETFFSVKEMSLSKVEIEIDQQQKWENQRDPEKLSNLNQVFEFLASASVMAVQGKCWLQLINLTKFTYNLIAYQMLNPFLHEGLDIWKNLTLICLNILEMLKQVKENGLYPLRNLQKQKMKIRPEILANQEKNNEEKNDPKSGTAVRFQEEEKNNLNQTENNENQEQQQYPFENPMLSDTYTKDPWFKKLDFDIELFANIIAYTIQSLMVEKKWNLLISISRDFCNLSDHQFSKYILHFTQYAQDILFQEAQEKTNQKEQELEAREKAFKEWQEKNKKKRSRQMQLTGEIPQEQQDFERDKQILLQQIQLLQNKEDFILSERERSQLVLDNIKRDSVKEILDLEEARKQLKDIGTIINEAIMTSPSKNFDSLDQNNNTKNLIKVQGQHCIKQYKTTADKLMAKKENFHCAQAKKELGSLSYVVNHYSSGSNSQILNSEEAWNEVIDLIFSQFQTVKQFRKVLASSPINTIAFNLGSRSILIAVNVLANLANISYYKDLHMARESIQFAAELVFSLFKISMPHPQILSKFGDYRLSQISLVEDIFQDKYAVDEVEIMASCEKLTWQLIDSEMSLKSLPLITISDYIATDLVKSDYYSARSKIVKAIALANCGQVNESYLTLQRIFNYKDLPNTWSQNTDYVKWEKGQNWHYNGEKFNNSIHPNEESNKQITEILLTKMELNLEFAQKFGQTNYNIFNYAKSLLVYIINKNEIFESQEINEVRIQFLNQAEEQLRQNLQKISFEEEQEYLYFKLNKFNDNDREQEKIKEEIEYNFGIRGLNPQEAEEYFKNREENIDYYQKRQERHVLIARIRYLLSQISVSQNLFHRGFLIIKQGIKNLINYAQEERNVETGKEPEVEEIDKLKPQDEPAGKGGKKEAPQTKKDDKKAGKQDKNAAGLQEERERIEKQRQEQLQLDIQENKKTLEYQRFRRHLSSFWILKLKTELVEIMYKQNRHQEALSLIRDVILPDCDMYRDVYFKRILKEIEGRILVKTGQYVEGITNFEWCIKWASINKQVDYKHVQMLGDYGEILYERSHYDQALQIYNTALKFAEQLLHEQNYDCYPKNFYEKAFKEGVQTCQEMFTTQEQEEEILTKQERVSAQVTGKGGKKDDKKKDDKKKGDKKQQKGNVEEEKPEMKVSPLNPLKETDYYNDEQKNTYQIIELEKTNNTKIVYNLYINHVVLYIKTVLRWVDCVLSTQRIEEKSQMSFENILKLLNKVEQMRDLSKNFLVPISLRLELNYMYAKFYKRKFEDGLNQITNKYIDVFLKGKNDKNEEIKENAKKYKKLFARKPYRDFARNRYLLEVPNFSQQLKENLIPLIEEAKKHYESAIALFSRGECLWFEHNRNIDDIFVELTEICLYKREYNPRVGYKYIDEDEFQQQVEFKKEFNTELKGQDTNVRQHIENLQKTEDNEKIKLENDAFKNMVYAVEISKIKQDLQQDYHNIANQPLTETNKIPTDIFYEIIEQDYLCKKDYNEIISYPMQLDEHIQLFDENKKKINIQTIDLLMILIKYFNESKIMTFNQNEIQIKISKLHRYLKKYLPIYSQKCIIPHIESLGVIQQGNIVIKSLPQPASNEYKLVYLFAGLDKAQIKSNLSQEEIQKIIINEEQNLVYGNIYVSLQDCDEQLQKCLDLRTKMIETDQHSQAIKDRDYANYKKIFLEIIETFGKFFQLSDLPSRKKHNEENNQQQNINKPNILVQNVIQEEEEESEVLQKYIAFVPELNYETIDIFIRIYGQKGLSTINISQQQQQSQQNTGNNNQKSQPPAKGKGGKNQQQDQQQQSSNKEVSKGPAIINHNILALFRYFHSQKYK